VVLPMKMGSLGALAVPMTPSAPSVEPCQLPTFVDREALDATVSL
jgi:hypothetical protein